MHWIFDAICSTTISEKPEYHVIGKFPPVTEAWSDTLASVTAMVTIQLPHDLRPFQELTTSAMAGILR